MADYGQRKLSSSKKKITDTDESSSAPQRNKKLSSSKRKVTDTVDERNQYGNEVAYMKEKGESSGVKKRKTRKETDAAYRARRTAKVEDYDRMEAELKNIKQVCEDLRKNKEHMEQLVQSDTERIQGLQSQVNSLINTNATLSRLSDTLLAILYPANLNSHHEELLDFAAGPPPNPANLNPYHQEALGPTISSDFEPTTSRGFGFC